MLVFLVLFLFTERRQAKVWYEWRGKLASKKEDTLLARKRDVCFCLPLPPSAPERKEGQKKERRKDGRGEGRKEQRTIMKNNWLRPSGSLCSPLPPSGSLGILGAESKVRNEMGGRRKEKEEQEREGRSEGRLEQKTTRRKKKGEIKKEEAASASLCLPLLPLCVPFLEEARKEGRREGRKEGSKGRRKKE